MKKRTLGLRMVTAIGACVLVAQGTGFAQGAPIGLTKPVHATKVDLDPGRLYSSPAFAVDPKNPLRVVAGVAELRSRRCSVLRSVDGGEVQLVAEQRDEFGRGQRHGHHRADGRVLHEPPTHGDEA